MNRTGAVALLVILGAGWGITQPLAKIAVSDGYRHVGIVFWQLVIGAVVLGAVTFGRGRALPRGRTQWSFCLLIALIGTVLPNAASFEAARFLPAGILSIVLSLVPMFAFPVALALGIDRFGWLRLFGLSCGLAGVVLLVAPDASLPERASVGFVLLALVAPFFYAVEGNVVAKWGTQGLDAVQVLFGASLIGAVVTLPLTLLTGEWIDPRPPYGAPDAAILGASLVHATVYATYVWMVGRTGAVFAAQVSYLVTGFGVLWAMALLGESYSGWVWAALALMMVGLFFVQPRREEPLVAPALLGDDAR